MIKIKIQFGRPNQVEPIEVKLEHTFNQMVQINFPLSQREIHALVRLCIGLVINEVDNYFHN